MRPHSIHPSRRLLALGAALGLLALLAGAGAVLGFAQAPASPSPAPVPGLPEAEPQAPTPLAGYQQSSAPALGDEHIAQIARREALEAGEADPGMGAIDTTLDHAVATREDGRMMASSPAMAALAKSPVVVVVLHGHFTLNDASVPRGHGAPTGDVLTLAIDAHTGWVDMRELTNAPAPGIAALGATRTLP